MIFLKTELALPLLKGSCPCGDSTRWLACAAMWEFATAYKHFLFFFPLLGLKATFFSTVLIVFIGYDNTLS